MKRANPLPRLVVKVSNPKPVRKKRKNRKRKANHKRATNKQKRKRK